MTSAGSAVLNFRMATTTSYLKGGERQEKTNWHKVVVWGKRGEALSRLLRKGSRVLIRGEITTRSYDKDGEKRYMTEIVASEVHLCGEAPSPAGTERRNSSRSEHVGRLPSEPKSAPSEFHEDDDDIPF